MNKIILLAFLFIISCKNRSANSPKTDNDTATKNAVEHPANPGSVTVNLDTGISISTLPPHIITEITNTPEFGNLVTVPSSGYSFKGKILKCNTLSFDDMGKLILENINAPYLAIVAKQINLGPKEKATIEIMTSKAPVIDGAPYSPRPRAGTGNMGPTCHDGGPGVNGANGAVGRVPSDGLKVPTLYILTNAIMNEPGNVAPNNYKLYVYTKGVNGGNGGDGQAGQDGGIGGGGGPSKSGLFNCDCGAGSGGPGGAGGIGGYGHNGGKGSDGGTVYLGGADAAINIFKYVTFIVQSPGTGGQGGLSGKNGNGGAGGARGTHNGNCKGGSQGQSGKTIPSNIVRAPIGLRGEQGKTFFSQVDVNTLFQ